MANEDELGRRVDGAAPDARRLEVLRVLRAATQPIGVTSIARELGLHPNTARFHLEALVAHGQAVQVAPEQRRPGRPPALFLAAEGMDRGGPRQYRLLAEVLAEVLASVPEPALHALQAGEAWGRRLACGQPEAAPVPTEAPGSAEALARLADLLETLGFDPARSPQSPERGPTQVVLRHCPYLELAERHTEIICSLHLGVLRGVLATWRAPLRADRLEAFAEPDRCLAHFSPAGGPA